MKKLFIFPAIVLLVSSCDENNNHYLKNDCKQPSPDVCFYKVEDSAVKLIPESEYKDHDIKNDKIRVKEKSITAKCVNKKSDIVHCGSCVNDCTRLPNTSVQGCADGVCVIKKCQKGYEDADGNVANGCEKGVGGNGSTEIGAFCDTKFRALCGHASGNLYCEIEAGRSEGKIAAKDCGTLKCQAASHFIRCIDENALANACDDTFVASCESMIYCQIEEGETSGVKTKAEACTGDKVCKVKGHALRCEEKLPENFNKREIGAPCDLDFSAACGAIQYSCENKVVVDKKCLPEEVCRAEKSSIFCLPKGSNLNYYEINAPCNENFQAKCDIVNYSCENGKVAAITCAAPKNVCVAKGAKASCTYENACSELDNACTDGGYHLCVDGLIQKAKCMLNCNFHEGRPVCVNAHDDAYCDKQYRAECQQKKYCDIQSGDVGVVKELLHCEKPAFCVKSADKPYLLLCEEPEGLNTMVVGKPCNKNFDTVNPDRCKGKVLFRCDTTARKVASNICVRNCANNKCE